MKYYPTKLHEAASKKLVELFSKDKRVMTILLTCSCARGKATKDSCLDIALVVKKHEQRGPVEAKFNRLSKTVKEFKNIEKAGRYSHIDLAVIVADIEPEERGWTDNPDDFELEIGNFFRYSVVLFDRNDYFENKKKKYLPYYPEKLRKKKLKKAKMFMHNNLDHVPLMVKRGLYFHAFSRYYNATQEFLQALFIKNRIYPVSYDKWIKEQLVDILKKPKLYREYVKLLEIKKLESDELNRKQKKLKELSGKYLGA